MRQAVLSVDDETLAAFGFAPFLDAGLLDVEILSCEGASGVSRVHVEEPPDERRLNETEPVQRWERVPASGSTYVYLVEMDVTEPLADAGVDAADLLRAERAEVHAGGFSVDQTGSQEAISDVVAELEGAGLGVALERLQDYRVRESPMDVLTDRQREVLTVAYEHGYYDVPRDSSTAEIAAELGVDDSTVAEHLQRAERNLLRAMLG